MSLGMAVSRDIGTLVEAKGEDARGAPKEEM